ncbi:MAG: phenylalanine--tRNA ligase subunit beta [Paludibacteraceae bacterium]|nr:phenylalanine--tRNA ligase subunit beta [Paludibacteraceae bacterium]
MNISYKWLKRYLDLKDDAYEVARILTSIGLEVGTVEEVQTIRGGLKGLVVGEVISCEPHENSDHLHVTMTRIAPDAEPLQIVCGAPNVAAGQKVIVATLGTVLYSGDESFTIKKSKIRGVESFGMICAEDEIGIGTSHAGIIVLPADAPVGMPASEYYGVSSDYVIEVDITPNRSDGASHFGVARDLAAYYNSHNQPIELHKPSVDDFKVESHDYVVDVNVEDTADCPRYAGVTISGVEIKESPSWLQDALRTIGLRPINNVVDATNFVLFEQGQALHSFDADKIKGRKLIVKKVAEGTLFTTLDGVERKLNGKELMICNEQEPMCIAGVFGGKDSGVSETTTNVFLESAYFDPVSIRETARYHGLNTDASFRFERGVDPNNTIYVLKRCALLIQEIAGGKISSEIVDVKSREFPHFNVELSIEKCNSLIGKELGKEQIETILRALEVEIDSFDGKVWKLRVPPYRVDVQRDVDVIEDILRIYGYNNVELSDKLHSNLSFAEKPESHRLLKRLSEQLTAQGFNEILNNSLTKTSYYDNQLDSCVKLLNPLSADLGVMRQTLLFGGLESISRNVNRKNADLRLYEFGNCYHFHAMQHDDANANEVAVEADHLKSYSEEGHLALWLTGNKEAQTWVHQQEPASFYQLRAFVNNLLERVGVSVDACKMEECKNESFSDAVWLIAPNKRKLGLLAIVDRKVLKQFDINQPVFYADLLWSEVMQQARNFKMNFKELPKYPEVRRDLALLVDTSVTFAQLRELAFQTERHLLKRVSLFDVYEGKNLLIGKKSYALSFILQDENKTLEDKQIDGVMQRLQKAYQDKLGAVLR